VDSDWEHMVRMRRRENNCVNFKIHKMMAIAILVVMVYQLGFYSPKNLSNRIRKHKQFTHVSVRLRGGISKGEGDMLGFDDIDGMAETPDASKRSLEDEQSPLSQLFPPITEPPSNFLSGIFRGAGMILVGACTGAATAIGTPIVNAWTGGITGMAKGLVVGSINAVIIAGAGVVHGTHLCLLGFGNTPGYCAQMVIPKGHNLTAELTYVCEELETKRSSSEKEKEKNLFNERDFKKYNRENIKDTTYYDVLGVEPNATKAQISKAFHKKAIALHPDRFRKATVKQQKEMEMKFKLCNEAHQILSDDLNRLRYNSQGKEEANEESPDIEFRTLVSVVFGNEQFRPYFGEPRIELMGMDLSKLFEMRTEAVEDLVENPMASSPEAKLEQRKRELELALGLIQTLDTYGTPNWRKTIQKNAARLAQASFGDHLLFLLGNLYKDVGKQWQGFILARSFKRQFGRLSQSSNTVKNYFKIFDAIRSLASIFGNESKKGNATNALQEILDREEERQEQLGIEGKPKRQKVDHSTEDRKTLKETKIETGSRDTKSKLAKESSRETKADSASGPRAHSGDSEGSEEFDMDELEEEKAAKLATALFKLAWGLVSIDLQRTITNVVSFVIQDESLNNEQRNHRLKALVELGETFIRNGRPPNKNVGLDMAKLNRAMRIARMRYRSRELGLPDTIENDGVAIDEEKRKLKEGWNLSPGAEEMLGLSSS